MTSATGNLDPSAGTRIIQTAGAHSDIADALRPASVLSNVGTDQHIDDHALWLSF